MKTIVLFCFNYFNKIVFHCSRQNLGFSWFGYNVTFKNGSKVKRNYQLRIEILETAHQSPSLKALQHLYLKQLNFLIRLANNLNLFLIEFMLI